MPTLFEDTQYPPIAPELNRARASGANRTGVSAHRPDYDMIDKK